MTKGCEWKRFFFFFRASSPIVPACLRVFLSTGASYKEFKKWRKKNSFFFFERKRICYGGNVLQTGQKKTWFAHDYHRFFFFLLYIQIEMDISMHIYMYMLIWSLLYMLEPLRLFLPSKKCYRRLKKEEKERSTEERLLFFLFLLFSISFYMASFCWGMNLLFFPFCFHWVVDALYNLASMTFNFAFIIIAFLFPCRVRRVNLFFFAFTLDVDFTFPF